MKILSIAVALLATSAFADSYNLNFTANQGLSFKFTCGTTALKITHAAVPNYTELKCGNLTATPVFLGDEDVDTVTSAAGRGWPLCTDSAVCLGNIDSIAAKNQYCKAGSSVVITCRAVRR